jgi:hypothetical protein
MAQDHGRDQYAGMRILNLATCMFLVSAVFSACGQTPAIGSNYDWRRVEQLTAHTQIKVWSDHRRAHCFVTSADEEKLVCSRNGGADTISFPRNEIQKIKLARRGHSTMSGLLLGAGIGAGVGGGITVAINKSNNPGGSFVTTGEAFGIGAAAGGVIGLGIGAGVGHATDWRAGPLIYERR